MYSLDNSPRGRAEIRVGITGVSYQVPCKKDFIFAERFLKKDSFERGYLLREGQGKEGEERQKAFLTD